MPMIDTHAHVWDHTCRLVPGARYHPDYEATIDTYLGLLDIHGIDRAVLVQPSFLGTDNAYLLACLRAHPDRLRGIVVLDPDTSGAVLDDMTAQGVIGLRYNLLSQPPETLATDRYRALTEQATARGWWIEVQANGPDWPGVLEALGNVRLMIDHFGKPSGPACPGQAVLLARDPARTVVKLSAPYRQATQTIGDAAQAFLDRLGPECCLWGSDWPWTQHEDRHSYADTIAWLTDWTTPSQRAAMASAAPNLMGFSEDRAAL